MLDEAKVKELVDHVKQLLDLHKHKHETTKKLLTVCLKHLKDRRQLIPKETWDERMQLIEGLETLLKED